MRPEKQPSQLPIVRLHVLQDWRYTSYSSVVDRGLDSEPSPVGSKGVRIAMTPSIVAGTSWSAGINPAKWGCVTCGTHLQWHRCYLSVE